MSSVYILNNKLCIFQQVILRSVGEMLRTRANVFGLFYFILFQSFNQVGRDPYLF